MEAKVITPTIGRVVWFWPGDRDADGGFTYYPGQPCSAQVAYVWNDRCVNLVIIDHAGRQHARTSVQLVQPGDAFAENLPRCEWMPYQKGRAAKTESLEEWKLVEPRPSVSKLEEFMGEYGHRSVRVEPNGDVYVRGYQG